MYRICVYACSSFGASPEYATIAASVGSACARRGFGIVYGGGSVGLMGALANAALSFGGEVIGVIPRAMIADAPSYSAVRTMIRLLESKGLLKHREQGTKYVYRPIQSKDSASKNALRDLVRTFFSGSPSDAVAALFDSEKLSRDDLNKIEDLISEARKDGR